MWLQKKIKFGSKIYLPLLQKLQYWRINISLVYVIFQYNKLYYQKKSGR